MCFCKLMEPLENEDLNYYLNCIKFLDEASREKNGIGILSNTAEQVFCNIVFFLLNNYILFIYLFFRLYFLNYNII